MSMLVSEDRRWWSRYYDIIEVEHPRGSYKQYCDPNDPRDDDYPMKGITYPADKGGLSNYVGEDGLALDAFRGQEGYGENGCFRVYRPDVRGEHETKFYFGFSQVEKAKVLAAYESVRVGQPTVFTGPEELEAALANFRPKN